MFCALLPARTPSWTILLLQEGGGSHCSWPQPQTFEWTQDLLFFIFLTIAIMGYGFRAFFQIAWEPSRLLTDISYCFMAEKLQVVCYHSEGGWVPRWLLVFLVLVSAGRCNALCLSSDLLLNHKVRWFKRFSSWLWRSRMYYSHWKKACRRALWHGIVRPKGVTNDFCLTTTDNTEPSSSTTGKNLVLSTTISWAWKTTSRFGNHGSIPLGYGVKIPVQKAS